MRWDIGIDLGTEYARMAELRRGPVLATASALAFREGRESPICVGDIAERLIGRTCEGVSVHFPLRDGALERDAVPSFVPAEEDDNEEFKVVRSKRFSIKPMSVQEAILQMNLLGHEFFVFRNMDAEDAISVVYERKNGGYGLICDDGLDE